MPRMTLAATTDMTRTGESAALALFLRSLSFRKKMNNEPDKVVKEEIQLRPSSLFAFLLLICHSLLPSKVFKGKELSYFTFFLQKLSLIFEGGNLFPAKFCCGPFFFGIAAGLLRPNSIIPWIQAKKKPGELFSSSPASWLSYLSLFIRTPSLFLFLLPPVETSLCRLLTSFSVST